MSKVVPESDIRRALSSGPLTLADLEKNMPYGEWCEDRRWLGITVHKMLANGNIQPVGCRPNHNHGASCVVRLAAA